MVLGRLPYAEGLALQERVAGAVERGEHPGALLLLEHPLTVTLGRRSEPDDLRVAESELRARGVDVFRVGRGGGATLHGPGQLVGYPVVRLGARGRAVRRFVTGIERALSAAAAHLGVETRCRPGAPGLWAGQRKVASIGIEVRRAVVRHGFAINVEMNLEPFSWIVPCGTPGLVIGDLRAAAGRAIPWAEAASAVITAWQETFGWRSMPGSEDGEWTSIP